MILKDRHYVVLDRDGTLIVDRHYLSEPNEVELIPGVVQGLKRLINKGLGLVVITNQSGIGRGFFDEAVLTKIHQRFCQLLADEEIYLDGIYFCPHVPSDKCCCRKPEPGLLYKAAGICGFNPKSCFVVGDKTSDIEMGQKVGATTLLVGSVSDRHVEDSGICTPDYYAEGLQEVAHMIDDHLQRPQ